MFTHKWPFIVLFPICFHFPLAIFVVQICWLHNLSTIAHMKNLSFTSIYKWGFDWVFFFFSFQHFKNLLYNSDVSCLWWQVSHHLFMAPLQIIRLFSSLSAFKLFVLSLVFSSFNILCLGSVLFLFILRIHVFLVCLSWYCPPGLRNFLSLRFLFF